MLIIELAGGLGNQLQQYALYQKFVTLGKDVKIDISWYQKNETDITPRKLELALLSGIEYIQCTEKEKNMLIGSGGIQGKLRRKIFPASVHWFHESKMYHPEIFEFENMYISGYFACEKYYRDILPGLRTKIEFPPSSNPLNEEMEKKIQQTESVCVHIRRGDYLNAHNAEMFGGICTEEYYRTAMDYMKKNNPDAHFFVFSDDSEYIKEKYQGENCTIVDINHGENSYYDMWLMSRCKNIICANSTFSFWGARLNKNSDKIMIRPSIHKKGQSFVKEEMEDLWRGWTFVSPEGYVL